MQRKRDLILPLILLALLLAVGVGAGKLYIDGKNTEAALRDQLDAAESSARAEQDAAQNARTALEQKLAATVAERDAAAAELDRLEQKLSGAEDDALLLEGEREDLIKQISLLRVSLSERDETITALEQDIAQYNRVYSIDVRAQADCINGIITALEEEAPLRRIAKTDEEGNPVAPPEGREIVREDEDAYYIYPRMALYYEDLSTGYRLAYGENETFFSASLIKAPYLLWLLEKISAEEDAAIARAEAAAAETTTAETAAAPETTAPETAAAETAAAETTAAETEPARPAMLFEDERYDLSRIFTYTEDKKREGSGVIQYEPEGTEYTYRELCELAIRKSDNVAFGELRNVFGYSDFYAFNTRLGINSVRRNFNQITAADMAIYLRKMYDFIETDANYGQTFGDWLCSSAHTVMIPYAVYPTRTAHKYGWDEEAYHDAAIVYNEHPYLLVVLTDLDDGGTEVDTYIRDVVKKVNALHKQFYR